MGKKLSTHYSEKGKGKCEIHVDMKQEMFYIKYYDNNDRRFFTEDFESKNSRVSTMLSTLTTHTPFTLQVLAWLQLAV